MSDPDTEAQPIQNDSFNETVQIVPKSQPSNTRNSIKITSYSVVEDVPLAHLDTINKYVLRYVNLKGQVISVFRTGRGNTIIRFWDGSPVKCDRLNGLNLFMAEDSMIAEYYCEPRKNLALIPSTHYVDIDVYGEHRDIAYNLQSGDIIVVTNMHVFYSRNRPDKMVTCTMHESGKKKFGRDIFLLNEEEQIVIDIKRKFCTMADCFNDDDATIVDRSRGKRSPSPCMATPNKKRRMDDNKDPTAETDTLPANKNSTASKLNTPIPVFQPAKNIIESNCPAQIAIIASKKIGIADDSDEDEIVLTTKIAHTPVVSSRRVVTADDSDEDEIVRPREVPPASANIQPAKTQSSTPVKPEKTTIQSNVPSTSKTIIENLNDSTDIDFIMCKEFFQRRLKPPVDTPLVPIGKKVTGSIYDFIRSKASATKEVGIQAAPQTISKNIQASPPKLKSIAIQTVHEKGPALTKVTQAGKGLLETQSNAAQTSPKRSTTVAEHTSLKKETNAPTEHLLNTSVTPNRKRVTDTEGPLNKRPTQVSHDIFDDSAEKLGNPVTPRRSLRLGRNSKSEEDIVILSPPDKKPATMQSLLKLPPRKDSLHRVATRASSSSVKPVVDEPPRPPPRKESLLHDHFRDLARQLPPAIDQEIGVKTRSRKSAGDPPPVPPHGKTAENCPRSSPRKRVKVEVIVKEEPSTYRRRAVRLESGSVVAIRSDIQSTLSDQLSIPEEKPVINDAFVPYRPNVRLHVRAKRRD